MLPPWPTSFPSPPLPLPVFTQGLAAARGRSRWYFRYFRYFSTCRNNANDCTGSCRAKPCPYQASEQVYTPAEHTTIPTLLLAATFTNRCHLCLQHSRPIATLNTSPRLLSPTKTDPPATPYCFEATLRHRPTSDQGSEFEVPRGCNVLILATLERTPRVCRRTVAAFPRLAQASRDQPSIIETCQDCRRPCTATDWHQHPLHGVLKASSI